MAEILFFHKYMEIPMEQWRADGLIAQILQDQREDGSWAVYHDGPGVVGVTTECYFALKLYGISPDRPEMVRAREFILSQGGVLKSWVFTRIHLAMFGILPWDAAPELPSWIILLPDRLGLNLYEFSSWARASIVPLLIIMDRKKTVPVDITLDELFPTPLKPKDWEFHTDAGFLSFENAMIQFNKLFKIFAPPKFLRKIAIKRCEAWVLEKLRVTEDIFPVLMYGAIALQTLGHDANTGMVAKALAALRSFQMKSSPQGLPTVSRPPEPDSPVYLQCCVSPTWDTAWAGMALMESGADPQSERFKSLVAAGNWLLDMQITEYYGDWAIKSPKAKPGGWAFEFQNDTYPDVDDTIEIMQFLNHLPLAPDRKKRSLERGLQWVLAMQSSNGGWGAFDKDNTREWVNRIPFSDHKACLDPPTADITARVMEALVIFGYPMDTPVMRRALAFVKAEQTSFGAWPGRWGVHYLYGTWCVLQGLASAGISPQEPFMQRGIQWLLSVQNADGGWSESCESYDRDAFVPLATSTASQTAWAVLALTTCGLADTEQCRRGVEFLMKTQNAEGGWDEQAFTGTGFPKYFYMRYHGYRHYFPLLALGKYKQKSSLTCASAAD